MVVTAFGAGPAGAQIVLDGSLGPGGALAGPDYQIEASVGTRSGPNLFHSFQSFDLAAGESASFSGPAGIQAVIGRVTGGTGSSINGTLRNTIDGADLFLVNPAGMVFGADARLDVSGSFYASTANYLGLADGSRFDTTTAAGSTLSIAPVSSFGFLDAAPAAIDVGNARLAVRAGQTLALVGGDLDISGVAQGALPDVLAAPSGRIELVAVAAAGEAPADWTGRETTGLDPVAALGSIQVNQANLTTLGDPGGTIFIRGGRLVVEDAAMNASTEGAADHPGVGLDLELRNSIELRAVNAAAELAASSFGAGAAGAVLVDTAALNMSGGPAVSAAIASRVFDQGNGGRIEIDADNLSLASSALISTQVFGSGTGGAIRISASGVDIDGAAVGSFVSTSSFASGNAGEVRIEAERLSIRGGNGFTGLASQVSSAASETAQGGRLVIRAGTLELAAGAQVNAAIFAGAGRAGDVDIEVDSMSAFGRNPAGFPSGVFSDVNGQTTTGSGGDIRIQAGSLSLAEGALVNAASVIFGDSGNISVTAGQLDVRSGGLISVSNFGAGDSGNLTVSADRIDLTGPSAPGGFTGLFSIGGVFASGAGDIDVRTGRLTLRDGARIDSSTSGAARAGNISVRAGRIDIGGRDEANSARSGISSSTFVFGDFVDFATGDGGQVSIQADTLLLRAGGEVSVNTSSLGAAGSIVGTLGRARLEQGASISAQSQGSGNAGNIDLGLGEGLDLAGGEILTLAGSADGGDIAVRSDGLIEIEGGRISAAVGSGAGQGGNIEIDSRFVALKPGRIQADAFGGPGGNIRLAALSLFLSEDSQVSASSARSVDGEVVIDAPDPDMAAVLEAGAVEYLDLARFYARPCAQLPGQRSIHLGSRAYEVLPASPRALGARGPGAAASVADAGPIQARMGGLWGPVGECDGRG